MGATKVDEIQGGIPVAAEDLPISTPTVDDSITYEGTLEKLAIALKVDSGDRIYCAVTCAIVNNDTYEGMSVTRHWLPLPIRVPADASKKMQIRAQIHNAPFGRFSRSFKLRGVPPEVTDFRNEAQREQFMNWIEKFYGNTGAFSIENSEFPAGSGRYSSKINDFVI